MPDRQSSKTRALSIAAAPLFRQSERFRLTITSGAQAGATVDGTSEPVRVGVAIGNTLCVEDITVSRHHFEITPTALGPRLRDLDSTNGTFVDGIRVADVWLPRRATVRAGKLTFQFETLGEPVDIALSPEDRFGEALGASTAMRELFNVLEKVAPRDLTILLEGESGTGKERLAEAIHHRSSRSHGRFVVFDCASVPASLMESELLGHERGAFTGAQTRRVGRFEEAHGGTLFLDEIGELPVELQPKLLRALEQREIRRVGGSEVIPVDVRVVAATNRDLIGEIGRGGFREDLYYRLAVVRVRVPPLRERKEDLAMLVEHFVLDVLDGNEAAARAVMSGISAAAWARLASLRWPGNVRELRNFVERALAVTGDIDAAVLGADRSSVSTVLLPAAGSGAQAVHGEPGDAAGPGASASHSPPPPCPTAPTGGPIDLEQPFIAAREALLARFEQCYLEAMLKRHEGNISRAARAAGIDRMHFKRLLARRQ